MEEKSTHFRLTRVLFSFETVRLHKTVERPEVTQLRNWRLDSYHLHQKIEDTSLCCLCVVCKSEFRLRRYLWSSCKRSFMENSTYPLVSKPYFVPIGTRVNEMFELIYNGPPQMRSLLMGHLKRKGRWSVVWYLTPVQKWGFSLATEVLWPCCCLYRDNLSRVRTRTESSTRRVVTPGDFP